MKNNLKERYIYAVTRNLPAKKKASTEKELDELISDMLKERCKENTPTEEDLHAVLTILGRPEEVALKYCNENQKALISGVYFLLYKRILLLVLPIVAIVIAGLSIVGLILDPFTSAIGIWFFEPISNVLSVVTQVFAVITIIFAILSNRKLAVLSDGLAGLPDLPDEKNKISIGESVAGIIFSSIFAILFLFFPQVISAYFSDIGWIPIFNIPVLQSLWLPILLWAIVSICAETVQLVEGRYTMRLAVSTTIANIIIAACAVILLGAYDVVNPVFIGHLQSALSGEGVDWLVRPLTNSNYIILIIVMIALVIETITVIVNAFRYRK